MIRAGANYKLLHFYLSFPVFLFFTMEKDEAEDLNVSSVSEKNGDEGDAGVEEGPPKKRAKSKTTSSTPRYKAAEIPLGRVKQIIKTDPDVGMTSADAVFLITKATELFIGSMSRDAYSYLASTKMKTMLGRHVYSAVASTDSYAFLDGALDQS